MDKLLFDELNDDVDDDDDADDVDDEGSDDDEEDDADECDEVILRFTKLLSIICALLVKTLFDNLRKVCVKFLDASANAGLSVLRSELSLLSFLYSNCCGNCFGLIMTLDVDDCCIVVAVVVGGGGGLWWNGIRRGGVSCVEEFFNDDEQHGCCISSTLLLLDFDVCSQLLLQLMLRRLQRHDVKFAEIGSSGDGGDNDGL